ncbi:MAG: hypothetical protein WBY53_01585 [Acidobacteriaceae bacterium]
MAAVSVGVVAAVNLLVGCAWAVLMSMVFRESLRSVQYHNGAFVAAALGVAFATVCFWAAWGLLYARRGAWITSQIIGISLFTYSLTWVATVVSHRYVEFGVNPVLMAGGTGLACVYLVLLNIPSVRRIFRQTAASAE